jgi:hypothetical protein
MARSGRAEGWRCAEDLLEVAKADTAHADLFLQRARELLSAELSETQYAALAALDAEAVALTNRIAEAMDGGDWKRVRELTSDAARIERARSDRAPLRSLAERVYGFGEVLVDPFSPGLSGLAGVQERDLPARRDLAVKRLERLREVDPPWADLYDARRKALAALRLAATPPEPADEEASAAALEARARKALADGDLAAVERLSAQLLLAGARASGSAASGGGTAPEADLTQPFAREVRDRAAGLGLAPERIESTAEDVRARFRPAWLPALAGDGTGNTIRLSVAVPGDAPEALRDTLELLMNRAFVTSAGTRYMPRFVAEDVLVEVGGEPTPGEEPTSPVTAALGLPGRWGLSRRKIEAALRERGGALVTGLGLDARAYRVVCLPVDLYTRLGSERGWGRRETWTHFDGYMASKEKRLMALVGGDVRFGGLHDLVAVGVDYDSDRLFARFAVVQRRRFSTW